MGSRATIALFDLEVIALTTKTLFQSIRLASASGKAEIMFELCRNA
jgi:hypothetical protein